jgi:hypothetical protein
MVATALRKSGDEKAQSLLENRENWDRCCDIALEAGVSHVTALDLVMAYTNPGGSPG